MQQPRNIHMLHNRQDDALHNPALASSNCNVISANTLVYGAQQPKQLNWPLIQIQKYEKVQNHANHHAPVASVMLHAQNVTILLQYSAKAGSLAICLICAA